MYSVSYEKKNGEVDSFTFKKWENLVSKWKELEVFEAKRHLFFAANGKSTFDDAKLEIARNEIEKLKELMVVVSKLEYKKVAFENMDKEDLLKLSIEEMEDYKKSLEEIL